MCHKVIVLSSSKYIMKPPKDPLIGKFTNIKQMRPAGRDERLPLYTTPLRTKYVGIQGLKPRMVSQQASIGNSEAIRPHLRSLPIRSVTQDAVLRPIEGRGMMPMHDRSSQAARPFDGLGLLGLQKKARVNKGNVDLTQTRAPVIYSFS